MFIPLQLHEVAGFIKLRKAAVAELQRREWNGTAEEVQNSTTLQIAALHCASAYFHDKDAFASIEESRMTASELITKRILCPADMWCKPLVEAAIAEHGLPESERATRVEFDEWQFLPQKTN